MLYEKADILGAIQVWKEPSAPLQLYSAPMQPVEGTHGAYGGPPHMRGVSPLPLVPLPTEYSQNYY